jgi:hypothetical protein
MTGMEATSPLGKEAWAAFAWINLMAYPANRARSD